MNKHLNVAATKSAAKPTTKPAQLSRRHFIVTGATAAGGLAIGVGLLPHDAEAFTVDAKPWAQPMDQEGYSPNDIDAWIAIDEGAGQDTQCDLLVGFHDLPPPCLPIDR